MPTNYVDSNGESVFGNLKDAFDDWAADLPYVEYHDDESLTVHSLSDYRRTVEPAMQSAIRTLREHNEGGYAEHLEWWNDRLKWHAKGIDAFCADDADFQNGNWRSLEYMEDELPDSCTGAFGEFQRFEDDVAGMAVLVDPDHHPGWKDILDDMSPDAIKCRLVGRCLSSTDQNLLEYFGSFDSSVGKWVDAVLSTLQGLHTKDDGSTAAPTPDDTRGLIRTWQDLPNIRSNVWPQIEQRRGTIKECRTEGTPADGFSDAWQYVLWLWEQASFVIRADARRHGIDSRPIAASAQLMQEFCESGLVFEATCDPWPHCLHGVATGWPDEKVQIITNAEATLQELDVALEADQMNGIGCRRSTTTNSDADGLPNSAAEQAPADATPKKTPPVADDTLSAQEVADLWKADKGHVCRLCRDGKLPGTKDDHDEWRIKRSDADAYVSSHPRKPRTEAKPRRTATAGPAGAGHAVPLWYCIECDGEDLESPTKPTTPCRHCGRTVWVRRGLK